MKYGVGIDISKGKSTVAVISMEGEIIETPFEITHNNEGLELLEKNIKNIKKENLKIVMENTGTYHLPVLGYLLEKGYFVVVKNALEIKKYLDRGLRKAKTDRKDAYRLAEYACENWYKIEKVNDNGEIYNNLKFLSRQYLATISVQTKQKINFSNLCDLIFPGYYQLLDNNTFVLGLEIFKKYYHPDIIKKKKEEQFIKETNKIAQKLGHKSAGVTLGYKIYTLAQTTISPCPNNNYIMLSANSCVETLISILKASNNIITEMDKLARELPEYDVIKEMPGCGEKLTSRIIAEIGDIRRFKNAGSLIAYAGLDAPPYQSGQFEVTNRHISKRGNKYLRKTGYEIMQSIKRSCSEYSDIKIYILKKEAEGKPKKVAKVAAMNKFLRMYYGIIRKRYKELNMWNA